MTVPARISIVTVGVADVARSAAFGYFADPDGHAWEVCYNPSFPIGPDGRVTID